jgi:GT2 family glycosyltransferase
MADHIDLSIIICTRNRVDKLVPMMFSIAEAAARTTAVWDLYIMDNLSTDSTRAAVESFDRTLIPKLHYRYSDKGGKTTSLNVGIAEAQGEIVALLDDDMIMEKDWMKNLLHEFADDPKLNCLGGRVILHDPTDAPTSIRPSEVREIVSIDTLDPGYIQVGGGHLAVRRVVVAKVGKFDELFGPGQPIPAAEDLDFLYRICASGYTILFCPTVVVRHHHGRKATDDVKNLSYGYALSRGAFYAKHISRLRVVPLKWAIIEFLSIGRAILAGKQARTTQLPPLKQAQALFHGGLRLIKLKLSGR